MYAASKHALDGGPKLPVLALRVPCLVVEHQERHDAYAHDGDENVEHLPKHVHRKPTSRAAIGYVHRQHQHEQAREREANHDGNLWRPSRVAILLRLEVYKHVCGWCEEQRKKLGRAAGK